MFSCHYVPWLADNKVLSQFLLPKHTHALHTRPICLCFYAYPSVLFISSCWIGFKEPLKTSEPDTRLDLHESLTHPLFHFGPNYKSVKIFVIAHNILEILQLLLTRLQGEVWLEYLILSQQTDKTKKSLTLRQDSWKFTQWSVCFQLKIIECRKRFMLLHLEHLLQFQESWDKTAYKGIFRHIMA